MKSHKSPLPSCTLLSFTPALPSSPQTTHHPSRPNFTNPHALPNVTDTNLLVSRRTDRLHSPRPRFLPHRLSNPLPPTSPLHPAPARPLRRNPLHGLQPYRALRSAPFTLPHLTPLVHAHLRHRRPRMSQHPKYGGRIDCE